MENNLSIPKITPREHIRHLVEWMSQGVYEKEQIIAIALLCAVAGENMFLLGPPGTAKSMVASRLKRVFKNGQSFDYLMSRFSTPDEIFGPISISQLKNNDRYERLTAGYLPEADIVFLDEIWKAGPSIQNTLLTIVNEHIFHNGGHIMQSPMKTLIAASNELPAKNEGLEALWDRFLVRMVSNCITDDADFFKMIMSKGYELTDLPDEFCITDKLYARWQAESSDVGISESVVNAIKSLRRSLAELEKEDGNKLRYYISDRRWRKAYRLMQTSAYLNGRTEINVSDYLLLIHSFWNDVECIPKVLKVICSSISDSAVKVLSEIEQVIHKTMSAQNQQPHIKALQKREINNFTEYEYFYYLIENFVEGDAYFSKWDYNSLNDEPRDGVMFYDKKRKKNIIHALMPDKSLFSFAQNTMHVTPVKLQRSANGVIVDGTPYAFQTCKPQSLNSLESSEEISTQHNLNVARELLNNFVLDWKLMIVDSFTQDNNIFLSPNDLALAKTMIKEVDQRIRTTEAKIYNLTTIVR